MKSLEIKKPNTEYKLSPIITKRWSARSFHEREISHEELMSLFEAASWSSSSNNEQPWVYVYATKSNPLEFHKFSECLMDSNKSWAQHASVIILSLARKNFVKYQTFNRHYMHDVGAANTTLLLQAAELNIYGHMIGGFHMEKTMETFQIPDDMEVACFIALGYLDTHEKLQEPYQTREITSRSRKTVAEFIHNGNLKL